MLESSATPPVQICQACRKDQLPKIQSAPPARRLACLLFVIGVACFSGIAQEKPPPQRRPLPKPAAGSRGFEQAGKDASSRLIAAGATRGPLKPIAPNEGLAYSAQPFFAWTPSPGTSSYHFMLREASDSSAKIVYEVEVTAAQLTYPAEAPALTPGQLYSWRVSMPGVMERKLGSAAKVLCPLWRRCRASQSSFGDCQLDLAGNCH